MGSGNIPSAGARDLQDDGKAPDIGRGGKKGDRFGHEGAKKDGFGRRGGIKAPPKHSRRGRASPGSRE